MKHIVPLTCLCGIKNKKKLKAVFESRRWKYIFPKTYTDNALRRSVPGFAARDF